MSLQLLGQNTFYDGQVSGDFCLCGNLDIRLCLMDTSLEIYIFEVTWTKVSV
jgi:hypothetical protein